MSGGVDSSVAALLMKNEGYECIGCTMKLYSREEAGISSERTRCSLDDVEDAEKVAAMLGMPHYIVDFSCDFRNEVIGRFIKCYQQGMTPNPCIDCNRYMKFGMLFDKAKQMGCGCVVTGHYARVEEKDGIFTLKKALDPSKDQSYVLYTITQEQLRMAKFPLGGMSKAEARHIAEQNGLVNADKPDSQDICFVPDGDYARVIEKDTGEKSLPGNFVDGEGKILGKHKGIIRYTVGQHRGLGLSLPETMYVVEIRTETNEVVLGKSEELFTDTCIVKNFNWISGTAPCGSIRCSAKTRYRQPEKPATASVREDGSVVIRFDEPVRAITPGQSAVLYDGDTVLGGGKITGKN